jgi:hypothetical protein
MRIAGLGRRLRQRYLELHRGDTGMMSIMEQASDMDIIQSYVTCSRCGFEIEWGTVHMAIRAARSAEEFLDLSTGLLNGSAAHEVRCGMKIL